MSRTQHLVRVCRYWGYDSSATLVHFHGPKPGPCLECLVKHAPEDANAACDVLCHTNTYYMALYRERVVDGGIFNRDLLIMYYKSLTDFLLAELGYDTQRDESAVGR